MAGKSDPLADALVELQKHIGAKRVEAAWKQLNAYRADEERYRALLADRFPYLSNT